MMKHTLLILFLLISISSFSQTEKQGSVEGVVYEMSSKEPIPYASARWMNSKDSTLVGGVSTDKEGRFKIPSKLGKHILEVSYIGYHKQSLNIELTDNKPIVKLDTLFLKDDAIALQEAEIVATIPPVQVKGDTIEFHAGAYDTDGSSVLKDLIKKIPGLEIDHEGNLKANGKAITKILVDGKEYFNDDISMALTTLPANMITKLQLFKKESEEAKASGIKDQDPDQVLNLQVKEEFKKSIYGDVKTGAGNKGRYTNRANINKMHGDNQYSLVGDLNNINDAEYRYAESFDDNINKNIGANFNIQQSEKLTINGSARYNNYKTMNESRSDSYSSIIKQYNNRTSSSTNRREDMSANASLDWKPDSLTTIYLRTNFGYNEGSNIASSMDSSRIVDKSKTSSVASNYSKSDGFRLNNHLMISRKLNDKGRNVTLSLSQSYNKDNSKGKNDSRRVFWEDPTPDDIVDQVLNNDSKNTTYVVSARYVEPIGEDNRLFASYSAGVANSERLGDVRRLDAMTGLHTLVDTAYSRNTEAKDVRQNIRFGFQRTKEKYNYTIGFSIDPTISRTKSYLGDTIFDNLKQNVVNYSPNLRFEWNLDKNTAIDMDYSGSTNHPYITQLSRDTVINSPMSKTVGNPDLKPSYNNRVGLNFRKSDFESGRFFSASVSYSYTFNSTVGYQIIDDHSNTTNTYRNVDGNSNAYLFANYSTPLRNKKFNIGIYFNTFYSKNMSYINTKKNTINNVSISPTSYINYMSDKVEGNLRVGVSHNIMNNALAEIKKSDNTDYTLTNELKVKLPWDFAVESKFSFSYRTGLGEDVRKSQAMWNLAASKLFLKDKRGTLKFEFFDVLNDWREEENTISGSDYNNSWTRAINNYFVFSFAYRFNILQGKSSSDES